MSTTADPRWDAGPITAEELDRAGERAASKLEWIIARYGDADGERLTPQYFVQLVVEAISAERNRKHLASLFEEKERTASAKAKGNPVLESNLIIA